VRCPTTSKRKRRRIYQDRDSLEILAGVVSYQEVARLAGIGDWGIMLREQNETIWFYPWCPVVAIRLAREEDLTALPDSPNPQSSAG
jgi:hypothetical protein